MKYYFTPSNGTVIICRIQMDDASVRDVWFRLFHKKYRHVSILLRKKLAPKYSDAKVLSYGEFYTRPSCIDRE